MKREECKILVVDDEPYVVEILERHLSDLGYRIFSNTNPEEGLKTLKKEKIDLVISDINMPKMDGIEFLTKIKDDIDPAIEVIIVSARGTVEELARAIRLGAADYLKKPFGLTEVGIAVDRAMATRLLKVKNREYQVRLEEKLYKTRITSRQERVQRKAMEYLTTTVLSMNKDLQRSNLFLEKANRAIAVSNRHKSEFLARMSHELRTPLNSIIGFAEVLTDDLYGSMNQKQKNYVENILSSGKHLLNLVNDILDLSKVEAGEMKLEYSTFSISRAIEESLQMIQGMARKKEIILSHRHPEEDRDIEADSQRLKQILFNLLSNAIKFSPEKTNVTVQWQEKGDHYLFHVQDQGVGIKREFQDRVFLKFQQLDNTLAREYEGTGLGLSLTRRLVEIQGGKIWLESEEGEGATFFFTLPKHASPQEFLSEEKALEDGKINGFDEIEKALEGVIYPHLHVNREDIDVNLIVKYLEEMGYQVSLSPPSDQPLKETL